MNDGILILAHGSRAKETQNTLNIIVDMVKSKLPDRIIEIGYMEFSDVNIEKGLKLLVEKGVTNIKVIPYFLFDGIHIKEDIPNEIAEFLKENKNIKVTMLDTLGVDERLADILVDRILG
jgi:sirohydrochlorin ferrochelatase